MNCTYALSIRYNDQMPITALAERGGLNVHLYNSTEGYLHMCVSVKRGEADFQDYWVRTIMPGDRIEFTYSYATQASRDNIAEIEGIARKHETYAVPAGLRIGFDFKSASREKVRLSHPPQGGFSFMLGNIPGDHARCFVMAENEEEGWNWQLDDLYDGSWVTLEFVETSWNTPFPRITKHSA